MAIAQLGIAKIRVPDFQELNWHLPLNENFRMLSCMGLNQHSKISWISGIAASIVDADTISLSLGYIDVNGFTVVVSAVSAIDIATNDYKYIFIDSQGSITASNVFPSTDVIILYFVTNNGGLLVSDLRRRTSISIASNWIHNGQFRHFVRGNSSNVSGAYFCDRWKIGYSGGLCTATVTGLGGVSGDYMEADPTYVVAVTTTGQTSNNHSCFIEQHIENVAHLSGKTVTISFYAWSGASNAKLSVCLVQLFGTGGSQSVYVWPYRSVAINLGVYTKHIFTITLPSVINKTITADSRTICAIYVSGGADYAAACGNIGLQNNVKYITNVKLEIGADATLFEKPDFTLEKTILLRYYEIINGTARTSMMYDHYKWRVTKRAQPAFTLISGGFGGGNTDHNHEGFRVGSTIAPTSAQDFVVSGDADL